MKEFCIIRTYSAGVFAGNINRKETTQQGTVYDAIRIWYWDGAFTLSQLAMRGTKKPDNCKFGMTANEIDLKDIVEVIKCTEEAEKSIKGVRQCIM